MNLIPSISNAARQEFFVRIPDYGRVKFRMEYSAMQKGWFMDIESEGHTVKKIRVVSSLNMLRCCEYVLGWGMACQVDGGRDPIYIDDFSTGRAAFFILNAEEIDEINQVFLQQ